jgi:hypothetical protein
MSTKQLDVRAIECAHCGGTVSLYAGHKVEQVVCRWCGSVLDPATQELLAATEAKRAKTRRELPLEIGDTGTLLDVRFTVIGFTRWRDDEDTWTDFCLFSPTHGYAWLTIERLHGSLSRRFRDLPEPADWRRLREDDRVRLGEHDAGITEHYRARLVDMAGELPSKQRIGDEVEIIEAYGLTGTLVQEIEADEVSWQLARNIPMQQLRNAFPTLRAEATQQHALAAPQTASNTDGSIANVGWLFLGIATGLIALTSVQGGTVFWYLLLMIPALIAVGIGNRSSPWSLLISVLLLPILLALMAVMLAPFVLVILGLIFAVLLLIRVWGAWSRS